MDVIKISEFFPRQGLGSHMLSEFEKIMKGNGFEAICLKAHPLVTHKFGLISNKTKSQIREEKKIVQSFYILNGYDFAKKGTDYMYKYL